MRRKSKKQAGPLLDKLIKEDIYIEFIKCIYSGPVNVKNAPSGQAYSFQPGQVKPIHNQLDFDHLRNLRRDSGPGCCSGSPYEPRFYFAVHKEV